MGRTPKLTIWRPSWRYPQTVGVLGEEEQKMLQGYEERQLYDFGVLRGVLGVVASLGPESAGVVAVDDVLQRTAAAERADRLSHVGHRARQPVSRQPSVRSPNATGVTPAPLSAPDPSLPDPSFAPGAPVGGPGGPPGEAPGGPPQQPQASQGSGYVLDEGPEPRG